MGEDKKEMEASITNIDDARITRLAFKGNYIGILEEFEKLRLKFIYEPENMTKEEAINFVTYTKYVMQNGHSEVTRLAAHYLYKKYIEKQNL